MKFKVNPLKPRSRIPEVGEFWAHADCPEFVYLRVDDRIGACVLGRKDRTSFFSLEMRGSNPIMTFTPRNSTNIIVLEPVNGVIELVPKE